MLRLAPALALLCTTTLLHAAPLRYTLDPSHTYPSFEADHMGLSLWRGKFNQNSGFVLLDKEKGEGQVEVNIEIASIDFGHEAMNAKARGPELFDAAKYPQARYTGKLVKFQNGAPTEVEGELNLHGVSKPLNLTIRSFKCVPHPMLKREFCGADAYAQFDRSQFGIDAGKPYGFDMTVQLRIQVEALADQ